MQWIGHARFHAASSLDSLSLTSLSHKIRFCAAQIPSQLFAKSGLGCTSIAAPHDCVPICSFFTSKPVCCICSSFYRLPVLPPILQQAGGADQGRLIPASLTLQPPSRPIYMGSSHGKSRISVRSVNVNSAAMYLRSATTSGELVCCPAC